MSTVQTARFDVPGVKLDEFSLILSEEAFTFTVEKNTSKENCFTVEVTGSGLQIAEAENILSKIGTATYVFYATNRRLAPILNIANNTGCKVNRVHSMIRVLGKTRVHLVEVTGAETDVRNFKDLKSFTARPFFVINR
jgi:hypothetical protein